MNPDSAHTLAAESSVAPHRHERGSPEPDGEIFSIAQALIDSRQNISPKRLVEPGPTAEHLYALLSLAAAAPDHGLLNPWRFIIVPGTQRHRLAEVFALASGQAMTSPRLRALCGLGEGEAPVCCINVGTVMKRKATSCVRPLPAEFVAELGSDFSMGRAQ